VDLWAELADERRLVAGELEGIEAPVWARPTTCGSWTVQQLTAHLTVPLTVSKVEVVTAVAKARGNLDRAIAAMTEARASAPPSQLVATLRDEAERRFAPPGMGPIAPLSDVVVHGIELRRAAGIERIVSPARLRAVLDFLTSRKARGFTRGGLLQGLRLEATDLDWSHGPAGAPTVRGPVADLLLAITGRPSAVEALAGDGLPTLAGRL
jgi:uncharacterized protein (TIGR03083 family)